MGNIEYCYSVEKLPNHNGLTYLFFSEGMNGGDDVLKIIQFNYVQHFHDKPVFNLGFGDYDIQTEQINDGILTNNGDPYKIYNTVLNSIPLFYQLYPRAVILVQGSDGRTDFESNCRPTCKKNCFKVCYNYNRRMKIYCAYVSRKLDTFGYGYQFLGGINNNSGWFHFEQFIKGKIYDAIMVFQKNV